MMGALVELDGARARRFAREHELSIEDALPRLLDEAVAAGERAGVDAAGAGKQKLLHTHATVDRDRPATLIVGAEFSGESEQANVVFDRWNAMLAEHATILRTFLQRREGIVREWIDEGFQKELDDGWTEEKEEEIRRLIESMSAASAERERQSRNWWRDWGQAALYPWRTRILLAASFAFFGLIFGAPLARPGAAWPVLLAVLAGAVVGLAIAEYGIRVSRSTAAAAEDKPSG